MLKLEITCDAKGCNAKVPVSDRWLSALLQRSQGGRLMPVLDSQRPPTPKGWTRIEVQRDGRELPGPGGVLKQNVVVELFICEAHPTIEHVVTEQIEASRIVAVFYDDDTEGVGYAAAYVNDARGILAAVPRRAAAGAEIA